MIKRIFFAYLLGGVYAIYANHMPPSFSGQTEFNATVRAFYLHKRFDHNVTYSQSTIDNEQPSETGSNRSEKHLRIGTYYRAFKYLKLGAFYDLQNSMLHQNDWIRSNGNYFWQDTSKRFEHVFIADVTPRYQLSFLPGRNWVLELKNRFLYNTYNQQSTYRVRPGLMYVFMSGLDPILTVFTRVELYIPINYGSSTIYESWYYLGFLYNINSVIQIGLNFAKKYVNWGASDNFKFWHPTEDYNLTNDATTLGLMIIFRLQNI